MNLWTVIPVKPFGVGKSRLAKILTITERHSLNRALSLHVLEIALSVNPKTVVISADNEALSLAHQRSAAALHESTLSDLNRAANQATQYALERNAKLVMVLVCDLPWIATDDVVALQDAATSMKGIVLAPDRAERGTNALVLPAQANNIFRFGVDSFRHHQAVMTARGFHTTVIRRPNLAFDLDTADDYELFVRRRCETAKVQEAPQSPIKSP